MFELKFQRTQPKSRKLTSRKRLCQPADIRMHSHPLRQLADENLLQVDCQNLLSTGLLQVVLTSCNKFANDKLQQA